MFKKNGLKTKLELKIFLLCLFILAGIFVFSSESLAGPSGYQRCEPDSNCVLGEFLFDGDYNPVATDSCVIDIRNPSGDVVVDSAATSYIADGWHAYIYNSSGPEGFYRTIMCCTVAPDTACMDKSFILGTSFETVANIETNTDFIRESTFDFSGKADSGSTATLTDAELIQPDDYWNDYVVVFISGSNAGQERTVSAFSAVSDTLTFSSALSQTVAADDKYILKRDEKLISRIWSSTSRTLTSLSDVAGDIWNHSTRTLSSFGTLAQDVWSDASVPERKLTSEMLSGGGSLSTQSYEDILKSELTTEINAVQSDVSDIGAKADSILEDTEDIQAKVNNLNIVNAQIETLLSKWDEYDAEDIMSEIDNISNDIEDIQLDDIASDLDYLKNSTDENLDETKKLQNQLIQLKELVDINRALIEKKPIVKTYYEWGSVILKMVISNPSSIKQSIDFKTALPKEVRPEYIISKSEDLKIEYDDEKERWYASASLEMDPGKAEIRNVEVKDIWVVSGDEIASFRKQGEDMMKLLDKTSFYSQGATLKSDIDFRLDTVARVQGEIAATPEEHIIDYRANIDQLNAVKSDIEGLKKIVGEAGSKDYLQGNILGISASATWAVVIMIVVGTACLMLLLYVILKKIGIINRREKEIQADIYRKVERIDDIYKKPRQ